MKRFHVHVAVDDLAASIRFYSTLFGRPPAVIKDDYAKWTLEDPRLNFAISQRGGRVGIDHLGLQTESDDELADLAAQLQRAGLTTQAQGEVACCYARSNKHWVTDPSGIAWETFRTLATVPTFDGADGEPARDACCGSAARTAPAEAAGRMSCC